MELFRFLVEIRTEAVMQALAAHDKRVPVMPLPSKRTSVNYHGQQQRQRDSRHGKECFREKGRGGDDDDYDYRTNSMYWDR